MTVVGKILVFLNLVFSLVVGAFAVMDYTARTHWADGFKTLNDRYVVLQAVNSTNKAEADKLAKEKEDLYEKFKKSGVKALDSTSTEDHLRWSERVITHIKLQSDDLVKMRTSIDDLKKEKADATTKLAQYSSMEIAMKSDVSKRQGDSGILVKQLADETTKNFKLTKEMNELSDARIQAQIQAGTLKDRNSQLEAQLQDVARDLARQRAMGRGPGGVARGGNPPPDNLEGRILRTDGDLVTISLGSDNGVSKDNILEVFRLNESKYIGKIRIVEVSATKSIGRATGKMLNQMKVNDQVASQIMNGP